MNLSCWNNDSSLRQAILNDSCELRTNCATKKVFVHSLAIFLVVVLGLPGNLFVIAVYFTRKTTSTRVYMFALAKADTAVCICGIVLTNAHIDVILLQIVLYFVDMSITFSVYLLTFVSIERLLAVWRPHSFSHSATRATRAVVVIAVFSAVCAAMMTTARLHRYVLFARLFPMLVTLFSVIIMTICYTLLAIHLLNTLRNRKKVGVLNATPSLEPGPSTVSQNTIDGNVGNCDIAPVMYRVTAKQTKTYKNVLLLFIVTLVFIACWLPQWLAYVGVAVSREVLRIFLVNSAVNPFIYSVASAMFRNDVRQFYHRTVSKLTACYR